MQLLDWRELHLCQNFRETLVVGRGATPKQQTVVGVLLA